MDCEIFMEVSVGTTALVANKVKWEGLGRRGKILLGCCVAVSADW